MGCLGDRLARLEAASRAPQGRAVSGLAAEVGELDRQIAELEGGLDRTAFAEDEAYRKDIYEKLTSFLELGDAIEFLERVIGELELEEEHEKRQTRKEQE